MWALARLNTEVMTVEEWQESLAEPFTGASPRAKEVADSRLADEEMALFRTAQGQLS